MIRMPVRQAAIAIAIALALVACKPADDATTGDEAAASTEAAGEDGALKIAGLPTEKDQASYMVGMDVGESLKQIEDQVDIDVVINAMRATLAGEPAKLTEEQRMQVRQRFAAALQEHRMAEMKAKGEANAAEGATFLEANKAREGVQVTESGLQYQVLEEGDGPKPTGSDTVRVHYKGTLLDGTEFDSSYARGETATFSLMQVVPGWQEGIALMPVGSKYKLWIPSELAYGVLGTPNGEIGPNATLVFEVELLEILESPEG